MIDCNPKLKIRKCNVNNSNCGRDWTNLPSDVLGDISSRLTFEDYNTFAKVCTSWKSARGPLSAQAPFLLLPDKDSHGKLTGSCRLLNLPDNMSYTVRLRPLRGKTCIGSQEGWLILLDKTVGVISLYNPLSQQEVMLPSHAAFMIRFFTQVQQFQNHIPKYHQIAERFAFKKVILSRVPKSANEPHPAAFAILQKYEILMYTPTGENSWYFVQLQMIGIQDIYCHRDQIFGVTRAGDIYKLNIDASKCTPEFMGRIPLTQDVMSYKCNKYIAELDGDVLQVWRTFDFDKNRTETVTVMKLDKELPTWITINDLQGHSLFLGTSNMVSFSSRQIPGLKDNLIYFTGDRWVEDDSNERFRRYHLTMLNLDFGAYNVKTDAFEVCPLIDGPLPPAISSTWFAPSPSELQNGLFQGVAFMRGQL